jgi:hypothetical protein
MVEIKFYPQGFYQVLKEIREYLNFGLTNKSKKAKNQMIQKSLGAVQALSTMTQLEEFTLTELEEQNECCNICSNDYTLTELEEQNECCNICSNDYNQKIISTLARYHSSNFSTNKIIETKYCPNCGRKLFNEEKK